MSKSFLDNYNDLTQGSPSTVDITDDSVVITPTASPDSQLPKVNIDIPMPPIKPARIELTEEIADVLTEQREQSAKVLEAVMKTNTKIANGVTKLVKNSTETNEQLIEAILALTDKIGILESKLEAIENLEIPTPIVHVQMPNKTINKEVHRDKKTGMITHITESEVDDE